LISKTSLLDQYCFKNDWEFSVINLQVLSLNACLWPIKK